MTTIKILAVFSTSQTLHSFPNTNRWYELNHLINVLKMNKNNIPTEVWFDIVNKQMSSVWFVDDGT